MFLPKSFSNYQVFLDSKMQPKQTLSATAISGQTFDYIVCGGGTSGCVIAAGLASIPDVSVLLIEAGRDSGLAPDVLVPGKYVKQLQDKDGLWELETIPQPQLNARKLVFLRGKQIGGSSWVPSDWWAIAIEELTIWIQGCQLYGACSRPGGWLWWMGQDGWRWRVEVGKHIPPDEAGPYFHLKKLAGEMCWSVMTA